MPLASFQCPAVGQRKTNAVTGSKAISAGGQEVRDSTSMYTCKLYGFIVVRQYSNVVGQHSMLISNGINFPIFHDGK